MEPFIFFWSCARQCDLVLDAAHRKSPEPVGGPRKEDIVESIIFKASDVVVVTFKDVDPNFARKGMKTEISIAPALCFCMPMCAAYTHTRIDCPRRTYISATGKKVARKTEPHLIDLV